MSHKDSPAPHCVVAVLEAVRGLLLLNGAHNYVAQHSTSATLSVLARQQEVRFS